MHTATNGEIASEFGTALQWYRVARHWTQTDFANAVRAMYKNAKICANKVNHIENRKAIASIKEIVMLCNALEITLDDLLAKAKEYAQRRKELECFPDDAEELQ